MLPSYPVQKVVHWVQLVPWDGVQNKAKVNMILQFQKWNVFQILNKSENISFFSSDGLLLYLDDGGYYDFLELKLVN